VPGAGAPAAQIAPATKDDRKDDGRRQLLAPLFKNQGGCVGYVHVLGDGGSVPAVDPAATPEQGSLALLGSGAVGLTGYAALRLRRPRRT
jgi:hypothetical protein